MMKVYVIKNETTGDMIRWEGSLRSFAYKNLIWYYEDNEDGVRRALANTLNRDTYYRGYKVVYYGEEASAVEVTYEDCDEELYKKLEESSKNLDPIMVGYKDFEYKLELERGTRHYMGETGWDDKRNVLVIGDLHFPFQLKRAFEFVKKVYNDNDITDVIFMGDILDNHYTGYHETDPDGYSANDELRYAQKEIEQWGEFFPNAKLVLGNHDVLPNRKAFTSGISKVWIKTIDEVLGIPWEVSENFTIGNFFFTHGMGQMAKSRAVDLSMSVVQGHLHSKFSCEMVSANKHNTTYAIQVGCLIDHKSFAMAYGKEGKTMARGVVIIKDILGDVKIEMIQMPTDMLGDD